MDSPVVLDSTALLALMRGEPGADRVAACLGRALVSTVNLSEVEAALVAAGLEPRDAAWHIAQLALESVPFDDHLALLAGALVTATRPLGLSLADRACLALAQDRRAAVYTANPVWRNLPASLGLEIEVIP